jgi:1-acyl-sn-glycerol-3-phosphate acyltransferase
MADRLDYCWRVCATALCFSSFGLGGLLLRVLVFPVLNLVVRQEHRRAQLARWLIHHLFRGFVLLMRSLGVISYEAHGLHKLQRRGLLILANHPSLIDVVLLMAFVKHADCIVKASLANNPFTRGPVLAAGFVFNDSGAEMVEDCIASLRAGSNLIIFPEGTRTPRTGPVRLQRGAANVAVRGSLDITPVRMRVTPPTLGKGDKWWHVPRQRAHFMIDVGDDIPVEPFLRSCGHVPLAVRHLTQHMESHFAMEHSRAA